MRQPFLILLTFVILTPLSTVHCQNSGVPTVLPPSSFQFVGRWTCEGQFRKGKAHRSSYIGQLILGEKWLELVEQDTFPNTGYEAKYLIGYDPQQKRFVEFDANTFGAATYTSEGGWRDGVLIMTSSISSDIKAPYISNRFVYTILREDSFTVDWQTVLYGVSGWTTADHLTCTKTTS